MSPPIAKRFEQEISRMPGPIVVHCASGRRAGLFTFMHVARSEGLSGDDAVAKAEGMGFQLGTPEIKVFFARYVDGASSREGEAS
jgi:hypothetical protein